MFDRLTKVQIQTLRQKNLNFYSNVTSVLCFSTDSQLNHDQIYIAAEILKKKRKKRSRTIYKR